MPTHKRESRYDSFVPELLAGRLRARKLVKKYNEYLPDDATDESLAAGRYVILKELIGHIGQGVDIDPPFRVDYGCNISIGDGFYANFKCVSQGHGSQAQKLMDEMQYGNPRLCNRDYWTSDEVWSRGQYLRCNTPNGGPAETRGYRLFETSLDWT